MNIRAKQIQSIDTSRMDVTTLLGFMDQMKTKIAADEYMKETTAIFCPNCSDAEEPLSPQRRYCVAT